MNQQEQFKFRWWSAGDLDGFFGLFVDSLIQLIIISLLCSDLLKMPAELVYGKILPGVAISILIGNLFYAYQAKRLCEKTGRRTTALPYGVNTPSLFVYIFFVIAPVLAKTGDPNLAWQAGLVACLGSGLIELLGSFIAGWVKRVTPRAALLATLAGIAVAFISLDFCFRIFQNPLVGFVPLATILIQYVGKKALPGKVPAGLVAVLLGTVLAWSLDLQNQENLFFSASLSFNLPIPVFRDVWSSLNSGNLVEYIAIIIPMGLFNLLGSLQNLESAEAAGDTYDVRSSLAVNGVGTIIAALFGSTFPTTIYIGHPAWKEMGAGAGYSVANGLVVTLIVLTGLTGFISQLIPVEAGAAILLWIGIIISSQAFQSIQRKHIPAVVIGLFPALAALGVKIISDALRIFQQTIGAIGLEKMSTQIPFLHGMITLERGFIFSSMILSAMAVSIIDKNFKKAFYWTLAAALISATGLMHGYSFDVRGEIINAYGPASTWPFILGYLFMGMTFLIAHNSKEK